LRGREKSRIKAVKKKFQDQKDKMTAITKKDSPCVLIIAGEASGDAHGAGLVAAMKRRDPDLFFCGIGGAGMRRAGVRILVDAGDLSVVGITEVFSKMPALLRGMAAVKQVIKGLRPDLVVLVDFPDFNFHVARIAKKQAIPVLYYISPQIWAWRSGRIRQIRKNVDHMAVILPFEEAFYRKFNVPVTFVGHPLMDTYDSLEPAPSPDADPSDPVIGLLPGSRRGEIEKNLPEMLAAASILQQRYAKATFLVSVAPSVRPEWVSSLTAPYQSACRITLVPGRVTTVFEQSRLIIAASGTVTLETAIYGIPMIIIYRVSPISYLLGRALVRVDHIGLANIIAGERVVPELVQQDAHPGKIALAAGDILDHPDKEALIRIKLRQVRRQLGSAGAADKTADIALTMLKGRQIRQHRSIVVMDGDNR
jgi:lipid-A-disaccharide synthase